ncbi:MAG: peptidase M23 [Bacteroidetes bacterium]|nr:MAG: peptidase M23 [Bacteroidota bacterium]
MAKYNFNLESLSFTKESRGFAYWLKRAFRYLLAGIALAVLAYIIYSYIAYTPRERRVANENRVLEERLHELQEKYKQLSVVLKDLEQRDRDIYRSLFESEPDRSDAQDAARRANELYKSVAIDGEASMVASTREYTLLLREEAQEGSEAFDELVELAQGQQDFMASVPSIQPVKNENLMHIAAPFGVRIHPFYKVLKMHTGVDYACPVGTPVMATAKGVVKQIRKSQRGMGRSILLDHGHGYSTMYSHLEDIKVRQGRRVERGDIIATVGNTGMSMAPHLHYEVRVKEEPVDPINYFFLELDPARLAALAHIASQNGQSLD